MGRKVSSGSSFFLLLTEAVRKKKNFQVFKFWSRPLIICCSCVALNLKRKKSKLWGNALNFIPLPVGLWKFLTIFYTSLIWLIKEFDLFFYFDACRTWLNPFRSIIKIENRFMVGTKQGWKVLLDVVGRLVSVARF